jgi:23S rRNA (adenine-C8)-methyltransferase
LLYFYGVLARQVFVAYLVLEGVNDSEDHAREVARLVTGRAGRDLLHLNLLRYNPIADSLTEQVAALESLEQQKKQNQQENNKSTLENSPGEVSLKGGPGPSPFRLFQRTGEESLARFAQILKREGVRNLTVRQSFGVDIDAACGQLFASYEAKKMKRSFSPAQQSSPKPSASSAVQSGTSSCSSKAGLKSAIL